jgi:hypothetical protein
MNHVLFRGVITIFAIISSIIRTVFEGFDFEREGKIHINQISSLMNKLGKSKEETMQVVEQSSRLADEDGGKIKFNDLVLIIKQAGLRNRGTQQGSENIEGTDPKVMQFLWILEEYRVKCEEEGNYLEASRAFKQLGILRQQEEKRQQKVIQARHISEKQDVQLAHTMQFQEFNKQWDKYLEEYDQMAQMYIQQMTERHALVLLEYQKKLREELASKPPKWSKALLDQRRKQHINARNKNYAMAQKLKKISDMNEEKERKDMEQNQAIVFARREAKFRQQQQTELQALLKRIECRRKEHIKQRELDTKRLLQRNRNVIQVLEGKQAAECQKLFAEIKKTLFSSEMLKNPNSRAQPKETAHSSMAQSKSQSKFSGSQAKMAHSRDDDGAFQLPSRTQDQDFMQAASAPSNIPYVEDEEDGQNGLHFHDLVYEDQGEGEYGNESEYDA